MRRALIALGAVAAIGGLGACDDGYRPGQVPRTFITYDQDTDSAGADYGMAYRACRSIHRGVESVRPLHITDEVAVVTCR